jgi:formylglycine-generating enzyme required for sulfatase activity
MLHRLLILSSTLVLTAITLACSGSTSHAQETAAPLGEALGISATKPSEGPSVPLLNADGSVRGYMVPYVEMVPGTDISFRMIPVPGGKFLLGSPEDESERAEDEGPQIEIEVAPMWVAACEVSWAEYKPFMRLYNAFKEFEAKGMRVVTDENAIHAITAPTELYEPSFTYEYGDDPKQPAVTMTQYAAKQYTKWLSAVSGRQYRLPGEAEWEYACRAGSNTAFSWGDDPEEASRFAWFIDNADAGPQKVGTKEPNAFGLYDMHGNVAEWVIDGYTEDGYAALAGKPKPLAAFDAIQWTDKPDPRTVRGGSFEFETGQIRSAARLGSDDDSWKGEDPNIPLSPWWFTSDPARGIGFRVFRSAEPLSSEQITRFWEIDSEDIQFDVDARLQEGRGGKGLVDPELPAAIKQLRR